MGAPNLFLAPGAILPRYASTLDALKLMLISFLIFDKLMKDIQIGLCLISELRKESN